MGKFIESWEGTMHQTLAMATVKIRQNALYLQGVPQKNYKFEKP